ncbi:MAG: ATP-dependent helicase [Candidatus Rokuibacteriota bacterium]|nr:MAG: ATP-dependent helicase [Candidatus Rokubacteria bacterium]
MAGEAARESSIERRLTLAVSPSGRLRLLESPDASPLDPQPAEAISAAFARGPAAGLFHLGAVEVSTRLPPALAFFQDFARLFVTRLCGIGDIEERRVQLDVPAPPAELDRLASEAPPLAGGEYVDAARLRTWWAELEAFFREEVRRHRGSVESYLRARNPVWNLVGRVYLHLAENKHDREHPFAFLATYTTRLSGQGRPQHQPLGQALGTLAGDRPALLSLLAPVDRAAQQSPMLKDLVDTGDIFQPLAWTPRDAHRFLQDVPALEAAGVMVRVPDWWRADRPRRLEVKVSVGGKPPSTLGLDALLDFSVALALDGEAISDAEWRELSTGTDGLVLVRGKWVELDREKLREVLAHWEKAQRAARAGLSFREAMRLLAGTAIDDGAPASAPERGNDWSRVVAGEWLAATLERLRQPQALTAANPGAALRTTLRPYQEIGVRWLWFLSRLGLGACLADDMGLGKTVQVLGLLLLLKTGDAPHAASDRGRAGPRRPSLLVVPASLIGNWQQEITRFAPDLELLVAHPSERPGRELAALTAEDLAGVDVVITTYGQVSRLSWIGEIEWDLLVLDEAQAIKNPAAQQARAVKRVRSRARVALTGTPIENRLSDLWSLFDFLNPGLLGSARAFGRVTRELAAGGDRHYGPLRALVQPYLLRRLKTDRQVIADLPDKTEVRAYCPLTRKQAVLYQQAVKELEGRLGALDGMERRGTILATLLRLKQICNHPSQWLGDGAYAPDESGKFARLAELGEELALRQEKALVFTQFREMTHPLAEHLGRVFGRAGLVLHGQTPVKERMGLVERFQTDETVPFFVLSLRAGGIGLNLTAASQVIHFDRWWNPAVESQATDRAFRIGQKRNVVVHQFVCRGTVEERIDSLIAQKKGLAAELLEAGGDTLVTEMSDEEVVRIVSLDLRRALPDE